MLEREHLPLLQQLWPKVSFLSLEDQQGGHPETDNEENQNQAVLNYRPKEIKDHILWNILFSSCAVSSKIPEMGNKGKRLVNLKKINHALTTLGIFAPSSEYLKGDLR